MAAFVLVALFLAPLLASASCATTLFAIELGQRVSMNVHPKFPQLYSGTAINGTLFVLNSTDVLAPTSEIYTTQPVAVLGNSSIVLPFQITAVEFVEPKPDTLNTARFIQIIGADLFNPYYGKGVQINATMNEQYYHYQYGKIELDQVPLANICRRNCFLLYLA